MCPPGRQGFAGTLKLAGQHVLEPWACLLPACLLPACLLPACLLPACRSAAHPCPSVSLPACFVAAPLFLALLVLPAPCFGPLVVHQTRKLSSYTMLQQLFSPFS